MLAGKFRRALERAIGANVGVNDSRRGTRGQLVGGTVEVQVAPGHARDSAQNNWNVKSVPIAPLRFDLAKKRLIESTHPGP
jgi:hypothetical protein